jgi:hypothetical protein
VRALVFCLLVACNHDNGCDGSDAEKYAKVIDPDAKCWTIKYGDGKVTADYDMCAVRKETWLCKSQPDTCWPLGEPIKVGRLP